MNSVLLDNECQLLADEIRNLTDEELSLVYDQAQDFVNNFNELVLQYEKDVYEERISYPFSKQLARKYLLDFIIYTYPRYAVNDHHEIVAEYLDKWVNKEIKYLIIVEPPRHGKSEQVSRRLPAFIFGKNPDAQVGCLTYSSDLATGFNRDVQNIMDSQKYNELFPKTQLSSKSNRKSTPGSWQRNSDIFEIVGHGGFYRSTGIFGGYTGRGFHYLIIDDPIKNAKEAYSKTIRDSIYQEYLATASTRLEEDGSILISATRWHEDDVIGRIIAEEGIIENGGKWTVLNFPAVKETPLNANDYDFREDGEILWEAKYDADALTTIYERLGAYWWSALYQGRPSPAGGGIIKEEWFQSYEILPEKETWSRVIQSWDTAFKEKQSNDFSVCTTWLETKDHDLYLIHLWRQRVDFPKLKRIAGELFLKYKPSVLVIEDNASGQSLAQELRTAKLPVRTVRADTSKTVRASIASPTIEAGRVFLPLDAPWLAELVAEMVAFPNGAFDDQVDSLTQAINYLKGHSFEDFAKVLEVVANEVEGKSIYNRIKDEDFGNGNGYHDEDDLDEEIKNNSYLRVLSGRI